MLFFYEKSLYLHWLAIKNVDILFKLYLFISSMCIVCTNDKIILKFRRNYFFLRYLLNEKFEMKISEKLNDYFVGLISS